MKEHKILNNILGSICSMTFLVSFIISIVAFIRNIIFAFQNNMSGSELIKMIVESPYDMANIAILIISLSIFTNCFDIWNEDEKDS